MDGIVIVTSPQDLVSMIVAKAVKMAEMMNIPIIGIVENMSYAECPDCGNKISIFGESRLEEVAKEYNLRILGRLPVDPRLAKSCDKGAIELYDGNWLDNATEIINLYEPIYDSVKITVNGVCISPSYPDKKNNGLLDIGEYENENVDITVTLLKDISAKSFGVFGIDIDKLKNVSNDIKTAEPNLNGNEITVMCSGSKNEYLYLAVPWDSGLTAYLNGSKTRLYKVNDSFCAIKLQDGKNSIRIKFRPEGLTISIIFMTIGILLAFLIFSHTKIAENKRAGKVSFMLCKIGLFSVILLIYIIPVIVYCSGLIIRLGV